MQHFTGWLLLDGTDALELVVPSLGASLGESIATFRVCRAWEELDCFNGCCIAQRRDVLARMSFDWRIVCSEERVVNRTVIHLSILRINNNDRPIIQSEEGYRRRTSPVARVASHRDHRNKSLPKIEHTSTEYIHETSLSAPLLATTLASRTNSPRPFLITIVY